METVSVILFLLVRPVHPYVCIKHGKQHVDL